MNDPLQALAARARAMPYLASLGMEIAELTADRVRIEIPYREQNANPGKALHGGVYASAIDVAGVLAAWGGVADLSGLECRTLDLTVSYLAAAIGCGVVAEARILRRGKELAYADVEVRDEGGKAVARGLLTHRFAPPAPPDRILCDVPPADVERSGEVPKIARAIVATPFMAARGMQITHMRDGRAIVEMPCKDENGAGDGVVHEGAIAALLDTAGAMASWSLTTLDLRSKASTVGIHLGFHAEARDEDVVAHARTLARSDESFLNAVTVYGRSSGRAIATGSVTYRIVVP